MKAIDFNTQNMIESARDSIGRNAECADQLVSETVAVVTDVCREWVSSKRHSLHRLIESSHSMSKNLIGEALQTLFSAEELGPVVEQISRSLKPNFQKYDIELPADIDCVDLASKSTCFEKYWFELNRTSLIASLMEEIKVYCWSMVLGDLYGWVLDQAILGSRSLHQSELKTLLLKQIDVVLLFAEQRISTHFLQKIIPEIYRQFDQREDFLRHILDIIQRADRFAEEILQVS